MAAQTHGLLFICNMQAWKIKGLSACVRMCVERVREEDKGRKQNEELKCTAAYGKAVIFGFNGETTIDLML